MRAGLMAVAFVLATQSLSVHARCADTWPAWQQFKQTFLRADGRVEEIESPRRHTVSEAQAYALFFALVANDREAFQRILMWTENNLAQGDLGAHLPAWQWGRRDDGSWGVLDSNAASDADLWLAYTLGEAGRIWHERSYQALSRLLAKNILREETVALPQLGIALLPGPQGFQLDENNWRLNPSYTPLPLLRRLAITDPAHAETWHALANNSLTLLQHSMPQGFVPDWIAYARERGVAPDTQTQALGSYDAIRVYLWIALMADDDVAKKPLREAVQPFVQRVKAHDRVPEKIDTRNGTVVSENSLVAFDAIAALLLDGADAQRLRQRSVQNPPAPTAYYSHALLLFANGFHDGYFRFSGAGELMICAR